MKSPDVIYDPEVYVIEKFYHDSEKYLEDRGTGWKVFIQIGPEVKNLRGFCKARDRSFGMGVGINYREYLKPSLSLNPDAKTNLFYDCSRPYNNPYRAGFHLFPDVDEGVAFINLIAERPHMFQILYKNKPVLLEVEWRKPTALLEDEFGRGVLCVEEIRILPVAGTVPADGSLIPKQEEPPVSGWN